VPIRFIGNGEYAATDTSPEPAGCGEVVYSLYHTTDGQDIRLLGTETIDPEGPTPGAHLQRIHPNPFNPHTTISFSVDRRQQVAVEIFDLTGRLVTTLTDQVYQAGSHMVEWSGADRTGRALSSGTYLVRLKTESRLEARKMMLLR